MSRRITPREIISFINEILTIRLLNDKFKERYIAIFVLKKDEILNDPLNSIVNYDYLKGLKSFYINDPDYAKQLTAIIYHIDLDNALELIYRQELKESLIKSDIIKFNKVCSLEFIDSIFISIVEEVQIFEDPIKMLSQLDQNSQLSSLYLSQAWNLFYFKALDSFVDKEYVEVEDWQILLVKNISDNQYLSKLLEMYNTPLKQNKVLEAITQIDRLIEATSLDRVTPLLTETKLTPKNFVEVIEFKGENYKDYKLKSDDNELDQYLSKLNAKELVDLINIDSYAKELNFKSYRSTLKSFLHNHVDTNDIDFCNKLLRKILIISKDDDLLNLLDDYRIFSLFYNNASSDSPIIDDLIAMRIARAREFDPSYQSNFQAILTTIDLNIAERIAAVILRYISYNKLLMTSKYFENSSLYKNIILHIFSSDIAKFCSIENLFEFYSEIKNSLQITGDTILQEFSKAKIDSALLSMDKVDEELIKDCYNSKDLKASKVVLKKFNDEFENLGKESYEQIFNDSSSLYLKSFQYLELNSLTQQSLDAFERSILMQMKAGKVNQKTCDVLRIYNSNSVNLSISNTLKNIRDQVLNSSIDLKIDIAIEILPYLIDHKLLDGASDLFRLIIKNEFLIDNIFLDLLIKNGTYIKKLYENANESDIHGFRNTINEKRESKESLEQLANIIGIKKETNN